MRRRAATSTPRSPPVRALARVRVSILAPGPGPGAGRHRGTGNRRCRNEADAHRRAPMFDVTPRAVHCVRSLGRGEVRQTWASKRMWRRGYQGTHPSCTPGMRDRIGPGSRIGSQLRDGGQRRAIRSRHAFQAVRICLTPALAPRRRLDRSALSPRCEGSDILGHAIRRASRILHEEALHEERS